MFRRGIMRIKLFDLTKEFLKTTFILTDSRSDYNWFVITISGVLYMVWFDFCTIYVYIVCILICLETNYMLIVHGDAQVINRRKIY
jgi:hypothetical protein